MAETKIDSPPHVARARIDTIYQVAKSISIKTGGDQAECAFELVCAAILVLHEARPSALPAKMIAGITPQAAEAVEEWFAAELKKFRCKHG